MQDCGLIIKQEACADVLIGKSGHRIFDERDGKPFGIVGLKKTVDHVSVICCDPWLPAGAVLGQCHDYAPPYYVCSAAKSFTNGLDVLPGAVRTETHGWLVSTAPGAKPIDDYWFRHKAMQEFLRAMALGGTEIARGVLLQGINMADCPQGCRAQVLTRGEVRASKLRYHASVKTEAERMAKHAELGAAGITVCYD
jgi:hypothetical protein